MRHTCPHCGFDGKLKGRPSFCACGRRFTEKDRDYDTLHEGWPAIDAVLNYLNERKIAVTKNRISRDLKMGTSTVQRVCWVLRKRGLISCYKNKYWQINTIRK